MKNIVVSGGCTKFRGFAARLKTELRKECDAYIEPKAVILEDTDSVYKALKSISRRDWFENICLSRNSYNEIGAARLSSLL